MVWVRLWMEVWAAIFYWYSPMASWVSMVLLTVHQNFQSGSLVSTGVKCMVEMWCSSCAGSMVTVLAKELPCLSFAVKAVSSVAGSIFLLDTRRSRLVR